MSLSYEQLSEKQIRIAVAVLGLEDQIVGAVNSEIGKAVEDVLKPFDITLDELLNNTAGGLAGGVTVAPRKSRKSSRAARKAGKAAKVKAAKASNSITPEQLASRQLQGRYLGAIRRVPASRRGKYQKIAKDAAQGGRAEALKQINRDYPSSK